MAQPADDALTICLDVLAHQSSSFFGVMARDSLDNVPVFCRADHQPLPVALRVDGQIRNAVAHLQRQIGQQLVRTGGADRLVIDVVGA